MLNCYPFCDLDKKCISEIIWFDQIFRPYSLPHYADWNHLLLGKPASACLGVIIYFFFISLCIDAILFVMNESEIRKPNTQKTTTYILYTQTHSTSPSFSFIFAIQIHIQCNINEILCHLPFTMDASVVNAAKPLNTNRIRLNKIKTIV